MKFLTRLTILAFTTILFVAACTGSQPDPTVVIEELYAAEQAHDVDAIVALFAEDAIVENSGFQYEGKEMITIYYNGLHTVDIPIEYKNIASDGNTVSWNRLKGPNPGQDATWSEHATIENGQIVYLFSGD